MHVQKWEHRISLRWGQLRWHFSDCHGLPRAHPAFSLEDIGCIPSKGPIATEAPSCFQILWAGMWPYHLSHASLGWGPSRALPRSSAVGRASPGTSPWRLWYLGRAHFIFFSEHLGQKSLFLNRKVSPTVSLTSSTSRTQELVTDKCLHFRSVADFPNNW